MPTVPFLGSIFDRLAALLQTAEATGVVPPEVFELAKQLEGIQGRGFIAPRTAETLGQLARLLGETTGGVPEGLVNIISALSEAQIPEGTQLTPEAAARLVRGALEGAGATGVLPGIPAPVERLITEGPQRGVPSPQAVGQLADILSTVAQATGGISQEPPAYFTETLERLGKALGESPTLFSGALYTDLLGRLVPFGVGEAALPEQLVGIIQRALKEGTPGAMQLAARLLERLSQYFGALPEEFGGVPGIRI